MSHFRVRVLLPALLAASPCWGGAFLLPEGRGQLIAGVGYVEATRRFDRDGHAVAAPRFRKTEASGYLEYGLTSRLSLILAPTAAHERDAPATNAVTGSDGSAFGARYQLAGTDAWVVAAQALVQPPMGDLRHAAGDLRVLAARSFVVLDWPGFVDIEPGVRVHGGRDPTEARFDTAIGLRPRPATLLLLQSFTSLASSGPATPRAGYTKIQGSIVRDLSATWSVQVGAARTILGTNAIVETGPFFALWYRF